MCYCLDGSLADVAVVEVGGDDEGGSAGSSMTMDEYSFAFLTIHSHHLYYHQQFRDGWTSKILPIEVVYSDANIIEDIRVVREPNFIIDSISTE